MKYRVGGPVHTSLPLNPTLNGRATCSHISHGSIGLDNGRQGHLHAWHSSTDRAHKQAAHRHFRDPGPQPGPTTEKERTVGPSVSMFKQQSAHRGNSLWPWADQLSTEHTLPVSTKYHKYTYLTEDTCDTAQNHVSHQSTYSHDSVQNDIQINQT